MRQIAWVAALVAALAGRAWAQPPPGAWGGAPANKDAPGKQGKQDQIEAAKLDKVPKQTRFVEAEYPKEAF